MDNITKLYEAADELQQCGYPMLAGEVRVIAADIYIKRKIESDPTYFERSINADQPQPPFPQNMEYGT